MSTTLAQETSCARCAFWQKVRENEGLCRRRAPGAAYRADQVAHWPQTRADQGCGDGSDRTQALFCHCDDCVYWRRYKDGLHPMNRSDMPNSWWLNAGLCTRHAPTPITEPGPRAFWRATAASDGCGEGLSKKATAHEAH